MFESEFFNLFKEIHINILHQKYRLETISNTLLEGGGA